MALLEVDDIHTYYGNIHALKGVSLAVEEGEIVTLIGANGAGKTTTLNTISGIIRPAQRVRPLDGRDLATFVAPHKIVSAGVVQVPEGRRTFARLTVEENLRMGGFTVSDQEVKDGVERAYEMFPRLLERRTQIAGTLSGGEQQMLAMGRALMSKPKVLLLDEPSMGLAPVLVDAIFDTIRALHGGGTTILLIEQNARMALQVADRGYVIESGKHPAHRQRRQPARQRGGPQLLPRHRLRRRPARPSGIPAHARSGRRRVTARWRPITASHRPGARSGVIVPGPPGVSAKVDHAQPEAHPADDREGGVCPPPIEADRPVTGVRQRDQRERGQGDQEDRDARPVERVSRDLRQALGGVARGPPRRNARDDEDDCRQTREKPAAPDGPAVQAHPSAPPAYTSRRSTPTKRRFR